MLATAPFPAILLVEDDPDVLAILQRVMRELTADYDILVASDTATALELAEKRSVRLAITDYHMAPVNGLAFATRLKQRTPSAQIVLISAFDLPELRKEARICGVDYYLPKPFLFEALEQIVQQVLV